ncbi:MAG: hypothetical protein KDA32_11810 [Phycisphaerales bacterium]|nr:hypothetical protein [Phycisphaerales bacterium]
MRRRSLQLFDVDFVGAAGVLCLLAVGFFALVTPIQTSMEETRQARAAFESAQRDLDDARGMLLTAQSQARQLQARLNTNSEMPHDGVAAARYRTRLLDLADEYGLRLASVRPGALERNAGAEVQLTEVQGRTTPESFVRLLVALRSEFSYHEVISWSLRRDATAAEGDGLCDVRWTVRSQAPLTPAGAPSEKRP